MSLLISMNVWLLIAIFPFRNATKPVFSVKNRVNRNRAHASVAGAALTILSLLQQLSEAHASVEQLLRSGVQVGAELRESGHLTVLSQLQLHGTGHLHNKTGQDSLFMP